MRVDIQMRIAGDQRGKITTGKKSENGYPKSLNHFNISRFPELVNIYGEKPDKLILFFPSHNIGEILQTEYNLWGKGASGAVKLRSCNGNECQDLKTGETKECFCQDLPKKQQCKCYTGFKAWVATPTTEKIQIISPLPYQFQSHSKNSGDAIYSALQLTWQLTDGKLKGIPFVLSVKMIEKLVAGEKRKFPLWSLQPAGTIDMINGFAEQGLIPTKTENALQIASLEAPQEFKQIESGAGSPQSDTGDESRKSLSSGRKEADESNSMAQNAFIADWQDQPLKALKDYWRKSGKDFDIEGFFQDEKPKYPEGHVIHLVKVAPRTLEQLYEISRPMAALMLYRLG